jgi:hypothetical protein
MAWSRQLPACVDLWLAAPNMHIAVFRMVASEQLSETQFSYMITTRSMVEPWVYRKHAAYWLGRWVHRSKQTWLFYDQLIDARYLEE